VAETKIDTLQTIELAEGAHILLRPAGPVPRGLALLVDTILICVILFLQMMIFAFTAPFLGLEAGMGLLLIGIFLNFWGYFIFFEVLRKGQTPGKKMFGLRVVRSSGVKVGWGASFMRNLVRFADMMPLLPSFQLGVFAFSYYLFGVVSCLVTRRFQRLGDLVADTVVIYVQAPMREMAGNLRVTITPTAPPLVLTREEQQAFIQFTERAGNWSNARKEEIVEPIAALLGAQGRESVLRALSTGTWLRDS
jgi:uncharacterized RDD family membrane protein YckC